VSNYNQNRSNNNYGSNNNYNGGNNSRQEYKKHSGAKLTKYIPTSGDNSGQEMHLVTGWRLSNRELISIKATTTSKSKLSDKGWFGSIAVTFTNTKTGESNFHWGTMEKKTGKVVVDKLAFVMNPKAKNGGYAGTYLNK